MGMTSVTYEKQGTPLLCLTDTFMRQLKDHDLLPPSLITYYGDCELSGWANCEISPGVFSLAPAPEKYWGCNGEIFEVSASVLEFLKGFRTDVLTDIVPRSLSSNCMGRQIKAFTTPRTGNYRIIYPSRVDAYCIVLSASGKGNLGDFYYRNRG